MFEVSDNLGRLNIRFSATLENIDTASKETKKFLATVGMHESAFDILLVMREALNNAVKHGSQMNEQKTVKYGISVNRDYVIIEIEDEGDGFDWRARLREKHLSTSDCGRGLAIMKEHFSDISFNEKGNRLLMRKKID